MSRCFVIQPFDGGVFDARYEDSIAPAIEAAGLEPYRVDRDPTVSIPIQDIEAGIRDATVCLADISLDNPNVWFELGFAIAAQKEVVMVCSDERQTKFPFDVQHRTIIKYKTGAPRNFKILQEQIKDKLEAIMKKDSVIRKTSDFSKIKPIDGLDSIEVIALASVCQNLESSEDHASSYQIKSDMDRAGFTAVATSIALRLLCRRKLLKAIVVERFNSDSYTGYQLTDSGWDWVLENKDRFTLSKPQKKKKYEDLDEDIPF